MSRNIEIVGLFTSSIRIVVSKWQRPLVRVGESDASMEVQNVRLRGLAPSIESRVAYSLLCWRIEDDSGSCI